MAGIRFQTTVYSYNSWSYFIQIWDRNYTGSTITEITLGQGGPQINWDSDNDDRFSTIMSSSCEIPLMVEGTLLENWLKNVRDSYEEKDVYVHIYRNTQATASSLIWSGFLLMDLNSTVDEFFPYEFKLTFTDGLSLLKEVDFVKDGSVKPYEKTDVFTGPTSYSFWMKTVLGKVGAALTTEGAITDWEWRTSINWYNTGHGASAPSTLTFDPFAKTEVQVSMFREEESDGIFQPYNCYDVLNQLLKHWGARIVYWRHKFWIIQIPEYNTAETGTLANPDNINTRKYFHSSNSVSDAFDNLNDYWTPYQVFLQASGVIGPSKIVGTKYDFKAPIKEVIAKYITGSGENYFGGFPTSENTVVTQKEIFNLADATNIYLDIPLIFTQNRANVNSGLTGGQFSSFSAKIYYQLAVTNLAHGGSTTKFLHYNSANNSYSWNTNPPSTTRPYWFASNLSFQSGSTGVMTQQLGGPDNGTAIIIPSHVDFTGLFDITIQIFNFVNGQASNKYAFIDNDTGANWADPRDIGLTWENVASVSGTTLSSSSYMAGPIRIRTYFQPNGNPFAGQLLGLSTNNQIAATAQNIIQNSNNDNNSSIRNFDELLWGDSPASVSRGAIQVVDTSGTRTTTLTSGQWGVGVTNGTQTFSKLLLDRFLEGQLTSIRVANFRLVIPTDAKTKDDGTAVRPQYINPVGLLVENRPQEAPMSYVMQRGTFHVLKDEWDFQGFEIQSESTSASTVTVTDSRGGAIDIPVNTAPPSFLQRPTSSSINSAARNNIITTLTTAVSGLGSDLVANGNFETDSDWTKGSGWSISTSAKQAQYSGSSDAALEQESVFTSESKYKVSIDVAELSGGELQVKDDSSVHQTITSAGGYEFTLTATGTTLQLNIVTGSVERTVKINSITVQEVSSTTSLAINSIGEAIFTTGNKFSLLNINNNTTYDLTINANQSANDTTLTITAFEFEAIVPVGSIVTFNKKNLIKEYQDDTLQEVTDRGNTTTNSIMIGSSSAPSEKLHVTGDALVTGDVMADTYKPAVSGNPIKFKNFASTELARITDGGNVGIGTTSPSSLLHIKQNNSVTGTGAGLTIENDGTGDAVAQFLLTGSRRFVVGIDNSDSNKFKIARTSDLNTNVIMTLDGSSNVGIGTTTPSNKLDVVGDVKIHNTGSGNNATLFIDTVSGGNADSILNFREATVDRASLYWDGGDNDLYLTTTIGDFLINPSNNVGIGTTSPDQKLDVQGNIQISNTDASDGDTIGYLNFHNTTGGASGNHARISAIRDSNSAGQLVFHTKVGGGIQERMRITSSGNVGIGLTNPQSKADINGTLRVKNQVTPSGGAGLEIGYSGAGKIRAIDRDLTAYKLLDLIASNVIVKISGSETSRFNSNGLGIGRVPDYKLDIETSDNIIARFKSTDDTSQLQISDNDTTFYFGVKNNSAYISPTSGTLSAGLSLKNDGKTGILQASPETELDVNGTCTSQLLQLRMQDETPSEPGTDKSIIFMDSNGDIKVLINVGGTTVTRTLATYA